MHKKLGPSHETSQFSHHLAPDCQKPHTNIISVTFYHVCFPKEFKENHNKPTCCSDTPNCSFNTQHNPKTFPIVFGVHLISMNMNIPYLIGVRSLPLLRSRCKNRPLHMPHDLTNVWVHNHLHRVLLQWVKPIIGGGHLQN